MAVPANSEIITPEKVLDKCEGGLKSTLDGDQVAGGTVVKAEKEGCTTCSRVSTKRMRTPRSAEISFFRAGGIDQ